MHGLLRMRGFVQEGSVQHCWRMMANVLTAQSAALTTHLLVSDGEATCSCWAGKGPELC